MRVIASLSNTAGAVLDRQLGLCWLLSPERMHPAYLPCISLLGWVLHVGCLPMLSPCPAPVEIAICDQLHKATPQHGRVICERLACNIAIKMFCILSL